MTLLDTSIQKDRKDSWPGWIAELEGEDKVTEYFFLTWETQLPLLAQLYSVWKSHAWESNPLHREANAELQQHLFWITMYQSLASCTEVTEIPSFVDMSEVVARDNSASSLATSLHKKITWFFTN